MNTASMPYDVLVLGAGPAGSAAAWRLAKGGAKVLLLEKERLPRPKVCGGGVSPEVISWLDLDLEPAVSARVDTMRFTWKGGDAVDARLEQPLLMVRREAFDHLLAEGARGMGADLREGLGAEGLTYADGLWTVATAEGPFQARYVIGADGANGRAATWLGLDRKRTVGGAIEAEPRVPMTRTDTLILDFGHVANGYAWAFPKADGWSLGAGAMRGGKGADYHHAMAEVARAVGVDPGCLKAKGHPILLWDGDQPLHTRQALLAGEAACLVDPFTAEGIRPSLWSGLKAAEALLEALGGREEALEGYSRVMAETIGRDMLWARRVSKAFFAFPRASYRLFMHHPTAPARAAQLLSGALRYADVGEKALARLSLGMFTGGK